MEVQDNKMTEKEIVSGRTNKIMNTVAERASYYRENPHIFCKEYLNITLKLFQKIILVMMNFNNYSMYLASRGQGKTFLTAIFCVVRCILYPGTRICIASGRRKQAMEVIEKITSILMPKSSNLRDEISDYKLNQADAYVEFFNGSVIKVVTASDSARSSRANILVCDEFRLVPKDIIQTVLRKFLTAPRQPGYMEKPEYANLPPERNKEIYMSSCWYQSHWSYEKAKSYAQNLLDDTRKYFICALPYQLAIKEKLLSREQVEDEMSESDFNSVSWMMEMECLFFSDSDGGLYSYEDIDKNRKIKYPFYPNYTECKLQDKRLHAPQKQENEIRILSADIALMSSNVNNNDATSIFINQIIPTANGRFIGNICYTMNQEGLRTDAQALSIRKLFDEYEADYLVIDAKGIGLGVVDALMSDLYDPNTGNTYPALSCINNKEIADRCTVANAPKKIWAIQGSPEFNSQCALGLREALKQGQVRLLMSEYDFEELMQEIPGYSKLSPAEKIALKMPYINTSLLATELVGLRHETKDKVIRVKEKAGARKDRYSSLAYNIYVMKQLEHEFKITANNKPFSEMVFRFRKPQIKKY